jgi:hypothetical protein
MDRQDFISDKLTKVHFEEFGNEVESVIALLVFALRELAQQGIQCDLIQFYSGWPNSLRGRTLENRLDVDPSTRRKPRIFCCRYGARERSDFFTVCVCDAWP